MTLRSKQSLFARLLGLLIHYVYARGWELTMADGHVEKKVGHMAGSLHYVRLAQDLNLFIDGKWISDGSDPRWTEIGEFWEKLHPLCRWGGRFQDANHFSLEHDGKA